MRRRFAGGLFFLAIAVTVAFTACTDAVAPPRKLAAEPSRSVDNMRMTYDCDSPDFSYWNCVELGDQSLSQATFYTPGYTDTGYEYISWIDCVANQELCPSSGGYATGGDYSVPTTPADTADDAEIPIPNCGPPLPADRDARAWCLGRDPEPYQIPWIKAALDSMRNISDTCAKIATYGDSLLAHHTIKFFDPARDPEFMKFSGTAPRGGGYHGTNSWSAISVRFVTLWFSAQHHTYEVDDAGNPVWRDLQEVLAHELDHLNGAFHRAAAGYPLGTDRFRTTNTTACSGLPNG